MDGQYLFCQKHGTISILSLQKGLVISYLGESSDNEEEDTINSFTASNDDINIVTHHRSGLFKLWNWKGDVNLIALFNTKINLRFIKLHYHFR